MSVVGEKSNVVVLAPIKLPTQHTFSWLELYPPYFPQSAEYLPSYLILVHKGDLNYLTVGIPNL